jgi:hypothetical protein
LIQKSIWESSLVKALGVIATLLTIATFFLQFGKDIWTPLSQIFPSDVPFYVALVTLGVFVLLIVVILRVRTFAASGVSARISVGGKTNILDLPFARTIVIECQRPQSTANLRNHYEYWRKTQRTIVVGSYGFNDYIERLEKEKYIVYKNGKWRASEEALDYIEKYHGGD